MSDKVGFETLFLERLAEAEKHIQATHKPAPMPFPVRLKRLAKRMLGRSVNEGYQRNSSVLNEYSNHYEELADFYGWLGDKRSKSLMLDLMVRKICNFRLAPPIVDPDAENARFERARECVIENGRESPMRPVAGFELRLFDLHELGFPITAYWHEMNVVWTFISEQYRYAHEGISIGVAEGDVVIDTGGCWGDTALYFASRSAGHVFSFEFLSENLQVFRENLRINSNLARSITLAEKAVWSRDGIDLAINAAGPATSIDSTAGQVITVQSTTIDTFVTANQLDRVDYIKMDIEGAERDALIGAEQTIKRFGPKLAIALYHKTEDFYTIPHEIMKLRHDYVFYVDHFTVGSAETVLFGVPRRM